MARSRTAAEISATYSREAGNVSSPVSWAGSAVQTALTLPWSHPVTVEKSG